MKQNHVPTHCINRLTSFPTRPSIFTIYFRSASFQSLFISSICKQYRGLVPLAVVLIIRIHLKNRSTGFHSRCPFWFHHVASVLSLSLRCIISSEAHLDGHVLHAPDTTHIIPVLYRFHSFLFGNASLSHSLSFSSGFRAGTKQPLSVSASASWTFGSAFSRAEVL